MLLVKKAFAVLAEHKLASAAFTLPFIGAVAAVGIVLYDRRVARRKAAERAADPDELTRAEREKVEALEHAWR